MDARTHTGETPSPSSDPTAGLSPGVPPEQPTLPETLGPRQFQLHGKLADYGADLHTMYAGAHYALGKVGEPDHLAQAAHSIRELMEKLPRRLGAPSEGASGNLKTKTIALREAWTAFAETGITPDGLLGQAVDDALVDVLRTVAEVSLWSERHVLTRRDEMVRALHVLDPSIEQLSATVRRRAEKEWLQLHNYFINLSHHKFSASVDEVRSRFEQVEGILMTRLLPETFADLDELDALIGGSDAN